MAEAALSVALVFPVLGVTSAAQRRRVGELPLRMATLAGERDVFSREFACALAVIESRWLPPFDFVTDRAIGFCPSM